MRHSVDAKAGTSSCGSMHAVRGLTACLKTAVGSHGQGPSTAHVSACCLHQLTRTLPFKPWRAAAAPHAAQQCRKCTTAAAPPDKTPPEDNSSSAGSTESAQGPTAEREAAPDAASSSTAEGPSTSGSDQSGTGRRKSGTRKARELPAVAAASAVAPRASASSSTSSSSNGNGNSSATAAAAAGTNQQRPSGPPRRLANAPPRRHFKLQAVDAAVLDNMQPPPRSQDNLSGSSSNGSSSNGSSSSSGGVLAGNSSWNSSSGSSSSGGWPDLIVTNKQGKDDFSKIKSILSNPSKQPSKDADYWGDPDLLQRWRDVAAELQTAIAELAAVSRNEAGPILTVFFDFETCGLGTQQEVVELAAVNTANGQVFESLVLPLGAISPEAAANSHKLSREYLLGQCAPQLPEMLLDWVEWLKQQCKAAEGGSCRLVLAGHNIRTFDTPILNNWLDVLDLGKVDRFVLGPEGIDTKVLGLAYMKTEHSSECKNGRVLWNLPLLAEHLDVKWPEGTAAHRSRGDVLVNQEVFRKLVIWDFTRPEHPCSSTYTQDHLEGLSVNELASLYLGVQQQQQPQPQPQQPRQQQPGVSGQAAATAGMQPPLGQQQSEQRQQQGQQEAEQRQQQLEQQSLLRQVEQQVELDDSAMWPSPLSAEQQLELEHAEQRYELEKEQEEERQDQLLQQHFREQDWARDFREQQDRERELLRQKQQKQLQRQQQQRQAELETKLKKLTSDFTVSELQAALLAMQLNEPQLTVLQHDGAADATAAAEQPADVQQGGLKQQHQQQHNSPSDGSGVGLSTEGFSCSSAADISGNGVSDILSVDGGSSSSTEAGYSPAGLASWEDNSSRGRASSSGGMGGNAGTQAAEEAADVSDNSSSSSNLGRLGAEEVEAAVAEGLESLAKQEVIWDPVQLSADLPLLGDSLNPRDGLVSQEEYTKLLRAGFRNHLEVLHHTPSIVDYHSAIPMDGSGSSFAALAASGASADGAESSDGPLHVMMNTKVIGVTQPFKGDKGVAWSILLEAPTNPPSAGPVGVQVFCFATAFKNTKYAFTVKAAEDMKYAEVMKALEAGRSVVYRGRLQPFKPTHYKVTWPQKPTLPASFQPLGAEWVVSWDGSPLAVPSGVDDGRGGQLVVEYEKKGPVLPADWVGDSEKGQEGIIARVLGEVQQRVGDRDVLPAELREEHGLSGWMEDLCELHNPSGSPERYQQAERGLAFRELVLMQLAQFLERYRLTTAPDGTINAAASILLPSPDTAADASTRKAAAPSVRKPRASRAKSSKAAPSSAGSEHSIAGSNGVSSSNDGVSNSNDGVSSGSDSSSDEAVWPQAASEAAAGQLAAAGGSDVTHSAVVDTVTARSAQQGDLVSRGAAAYSVQHDDVVQTAKESLPWQLTRGQEQVLSEVLDDMRGPRAMLRLLQGDVGCGKTIIALLACLATAASGYQALLFAPTELLANQHLKTLQAIAERLPLSMRPCVELLVGGQQGKARRELRQKISRGEANIIISTQAALWVEEWGKMALVVVDEQHKLGVKQREKLTRGLEAPPHMLLMTATPIPRTLAILQYGGLTLSTISELPPGRTPVETRVIEDAAEGRHKVYEAIKQEIASGGRAYIVCPLVDESDTSEGLRTVEDEFARLSSSGIFGDSSKCGKLHGKLKAPEKAEVLEKFRSGETPVLIASTVVEVGVDVPEASIMLVESAHRFGLAQLHQLRGRVGRGSKASRCFLMAPAGDDRAAVRLRELEKSQNGLHIAEADLKLRGFGDLWSGTKQSGKNSQLTAITRRQLEADLTIVHQARYAAAKMLLTISTNHVLKQALLAYGIMVLQDGQKLPVVRDGISGM